VAGERGFLTTEDTEVPRGPGGKLANEPLSPDVSGYEQFDLLPL